MDYLLRSHRGTLYILVLAGLCGCDQPRVADHPLDPARARTSVKAALQAWVDGKNPSDLKPEIIVGDIAWNQGRKLSSFEIVTGEETSDGSNLHIRVNRKFSNGSNGADSKVTYIVGTSPIVTIFPQ